MTSLLVAVFWSSISVIAYTYAIYPLMLFLVRRFGTAWRQGSHFPPSVSIVVAARNEEDKIARRVAEIVQHLKHSSIEGEIIVVSDGSTDDTAEIVEGLAHSNVRILDLCEHSGKSEAINRGCALAKGNVIVLADTRQTWDHEAVLRLLENFNDPDVGAASAELVLKESDGSLAGVDLYWRLEKWMRRQESSIHSCVGVTGAMCAVRKQLFRPIPAGAILDDVYWPLCVVLMGYRVVHDQRARTFDQLPHRSRDEFHRKVRTLAGNFQLVFLLPSVLRPWRNPAFVPFVSHKLMRLLVPWAMLGLFLSSGLLDGGLYRVAFIAQCVAYVSALLGLSSSAACRVPMVSAAAAVLLLNVACWAAFFVWISGGAIRMWRPVSYESTD